MNMLNEIQIWSAKDTEQITAASDSTTSSKILSLLATSPWIEVREKVAENPNSPSNILDVMMQDCETVRAGLARNPKAIERLWLLAMDASPKVRQCLAENPNLPEHAYQALTKDSDVRVATGAAHTLRKLRRDEDPVRVLFKFFAKAA